MSKIKFGNFITYTGRYLSTAMSKAQSGNLVFARIINSPSEMELKAKVTLENVIVDGVLQTSYEVNNVGKDGYYIFGGKADGHLVTFDVFEALKAEVAALNTKVGDLSIGEGESKVTYKDVPAYVDARLGGAAALGVTTDVRDADNATDEVLPTEKAVRTAIDTAVNTIEGKIEALPTYGVSGSTNISVTPSVLNGHHNFTVDITDKVATKAYVNAQVSKIDGVMEFKGTVDALPTVTADSTDYNPGDVVVFNGEEYVLGTDYNWVEIGKVGYDEAVTSAQGSTYVSITGDNIQGVTGLRGDITISVITSDIEEGATGLATAADVYTAIEAAKDAATVIGATGYLKVDDDKNVVVDAAQVQMGTTSTNTKLATAGYVEDIAEQLGADITAAAAEAAKHSSVVSKSEDYIGVTGVTAANGGVEYQVSLKAEALKAEKHSISEIKINDESVTTAATVQEALQDLFEGDKTASEALNDLDKRLEAHIGSTQAHAAEHITFAGATGATATNVEEALDELYAKVADAAKSGNAENIDYKPADGVPVPEGVDKVNEALDDLYTQLAALDGAAIKDVTGDAASYSEVVSSEDDEQVKIVKNVLATAVDTSDIEDYTAAAATGLATDAYVQDYVAYTLAWEVLAD